MRRVLMVLWVLSGAVAGGAGMAGCAPNAGGQRGSGGEAGTGIAVVRAASPLASLGELEVVGERIVARGARQEWLEALIRPVPAGTQGDGRGETILRWTGLTWQPPDGTASPEGLAAVGAPGAWSVRAYRVEEVAFDARRVEVVREVGPGVSDRLPLALVPLAGSAEGGFRVPAGTKLVYVEWRAPLAAEPGRWTGWLEATGGGAAPRRAAIEVVVDDLALSETPPVAIYGELDWAALEKVWPREFKSVEPRFLSRGDAAMSAAVSRLDEMVVMARQNRVDVGFGRLQPTVKNTPREGLRFDWTEYDTLVLPWLRGELPGMSSGAVLGLPQADALRSGAVTKGEYWATVVSHFDQLRLLGQTVRPPGVEGADLGSVGESRVRGAVGGAGAALMSLEGFRQSAWSLAGRVEAASAAGGGSVVWLGSGAGERDAAGAVGSAVGVGPGAFGAWFFAGEPFGVREVVPGMALKWARRAQQDWELVDLARRRGATRVALTVAQRMTRAGVRQPEVAGDLLAPVVSRSVWDEGLRIVRDAAVSRDPAKVPTDEEMSARELSEEEAIRRWSSSVDRPLIWASTTEYGREQEAGFVPVSVSMEFAETGTEATIVSLPDGWTEVVEKSGTDGLTLSARIDPSRVRYPINRAVDERGRLLPSIGTLDIESVSGPDRIRTRRETILPAVRVGRSDEPTLLDGSLSDWTQAELVADGGLVRMLDRSSLQGSELRRSQKPTQVLMRWESGALLVAIRAEGVDSGAFARQGGVGGVGVTNFTRERLGRAFGEDLIRLVLRSDEREVRLLVKPTGVTVEGVSVLGGRATSPAEAGSGGVKYAASLEPGPSEGAPGVWRAEMSIPAALLRSGELDSGSALQMNLIRHDAATGESASWAGPIDRDYQNLRGVLLLVDTINPAGRSGATGGRAGRQSR